MRVLELFCGTKSIGKWISEHRPDWEVISLDILPNFNPTICTDIMEWDYEIYPVHHFDLIWASPECKIYSTLQDSFHIKKWGSVENLAQARSEHSKYVLKALEVIGYFKPTSWFIENPWMSKMKDIEPLKSMFSNRLDYCQFGFEYKKPTRIWSNKSIEDKICKCKGKHLKSIGKFGTCSTTLNERYSIPPKLLEYLFANL